MTESSAIATQSGSFVRPSSSLPIAVIGLGCRFPGGANDAASFWNLLSRGIDAVGEVPDDRWSPRTLFAPLPLKPGKSYSRWGGFVPGIDQFDAEFFGISPREAAAMDPQQRWMLEVAWEALEDAGLSADRLSGRNVGVFVGCSSNDYMQLQWDPHDLRRFGPYSNVGGTLSIVANRISYLFDFRGPSLAVDTACSSSLVALDVACESLRRGESELALAGGVNALLLPVGYVGFSQARMLSPDGRCRTFDSRANGYARAEGAGLVVLKPLPKALADGDTIHAVVLASGVNQDGRTTGISLPSEDAQAALIREVHARAGIDPNDVGYFEAHGTGTPVGDPIEARAVGRSLGRLRTRGNRLPIGSVKTNLGHLESASGIAGLIKSVLCLRHAQIPATLHFESPNPAIDLDELGLRVVSRHEAWDTDDGRKRIAVVNSFGFGGTNAHAVLCEAPRPEEARARHREYDTVSISLSSGVDVPEPAAARVWPVALSSRSAAGLKTTAQSWVEWLDGLPGSAPDVTLARVAHSSTVRRAHHPHRVSIAASDLPQLKELLGAWLRDERRRQISSGKAGAEGPTTAFVFNGIGSQWHGMGRDLLETEPAFQRAFARVDAEFRSLAGWGLLEELERDEFRSRLQEAEVAQPLIFAVQVSLAELWKSWGVEPSMIVGHSVGEVAAGYVAGLLSLPDAVRVIFHRSRLQQRLRGRGRMLAVSMPIDLAQSMAEAWENRVAVAAVNGPNSVTLSGDGAALEELHRAMEASQAFCRFLSVDVPYHGPSMDVIEEELRASLAGLECRRSSVRFFSTADGTEPTDPRLDADYWWRNVRQPVLFSSAMEALLAARPDVVLEIGAHPVLSNAIRECAADRIDSLAVLASLRRGESGRTTMLEALGKIYSLGGPVRWEGVLSESEPAVRLPAYLWQRSSFWSETEDNRSARRGTGGSSSGGLLGNASHPLLGQRIQSSHESNAWHQQIDLDGAHAWLADHRVQQTPVFPAAGYAELSLAAGAEQTPGQPLCLERLEMQKPLVMPEGEQTSLETVINPASGDVTFHGRTDGEWVRYASGRVRVDFGEWNDAGLADELRDLRSRCTTSVCAEVAQERFAALGLHYGPGFRGLEAVSVGPGGAVGRVRLPENLREDSDRYRLHPAAFDACLQLALCAHEWDEASGDKGRLHLPVMVRRLRLRDPEAMGKLCADGFGVAIRLRPSAEGTILADGFLFDDSGRVVAQLEHFEAKQFAAPRGGEVELKDCLWDHRWERRPRQGESDPDGMPYPRDLVAAPAARLPTLRERFDSRRVYEEAYPGIDELARAFVVRALRELGLRFEAGEALVPEELIERLGIAPVQVPLFRASLRHLEAAGILRSTAGRLEVIASPPETDPRALWRGASRRWPALHADLLALWRTGTNFAPILRGEVNPLEVMFPGGSSAVVEQMYEDSPRFAVYNALFQEVVRELVRQLPADRRLRVLEVGGGTGSLSASILRALPAERTEYVFTDVTGQFLGPAQQKFSEFPFVRCEVFDLERDPVEQGFEPGSFDIVLGADVVHATTDVRRSLRHLRSLLSPGGLLLLLELVRRDVCQDITFGVLRGWWHFTDSDLRTESPLLPSAAWRGLLAEAGFDDAIALSDVAEDQNPMHAILMGRLAAAAGLSAGDEGRQEAAATGASPASMRGRSWWLFADSTGAAAGLARRLREAGGKGTIIRFGTQFRKVEPGAYEMRPDVAGDYRALWDAVTATAGPPDCIVHLAGLDAPLGDDVTTGSIRASQSGGALSLLHLTHTVMAAEAESIPRIWLVTRAVHSVGLPEGSPVCVAAAPLWGMARVLYNEFPRARPGAIDLSAPADEGELDSLFREIASEGSETEIVLRGGQRFVSRICSGFAEGEPGGPARPASFRVEIGTPGLIDSLKLEPAPRTAPQPGQVEIEVSATAVNFKDVAKAMNLLTGATLSETWSGRSLGLECAGSVVAVGEGVSHVRVNDRVVALAADCFRPFVTVGADFVRRIPEGMSFEEAAGIPVVFLTAAYALRELARLRRGERVLIHAAAGGVGLAAIQIAQKAGAEVFATAGNPVKRDYVRSLGVQHVFDSRSLAFVDEIRAATSGEGVDVVLNSLAGAAIPASLSLLRSGGRFIEIGKRDIQENAPLGLRPFDQNLAWMSLDLDRLIGSKSAELQAMLDGLLEELTDGSLSPVACRTSPVSRIADAFRHMAKARQIGKLVVRMQDEHVRVGDEPLETGSLQFDPEGTFLVTGGLSGFGLESARWLVSHGARHLALMSRRGGETLEARAAIAELEALGARVAAFAVNVADEASLAEALATIRRTQPPLKGVFHAAMVLDDGLMTELTPERMETVLAPKAWGAWNLHKLTQHDPLDHFVLFSSATTVVGNPGQANYVAACTFLDRLAQHRRNLHLPAISVAWGAVEDVGYLARNEDVMRHVLGRLGLRPVPSARMLEFLERVMLRSACHPAISPIDWSRMAQFELLSTPRAEAVRPKETGPAAEGSASGSMRDRLKDASEADRGPLLSAFLVQIAAGVLGSSPAETPADRSLTLIGLDSLMGVELQARISRELGYEVSSMRLMAGPSINELTEELLHGASR